MTLVISAQDIQSATFGLVKDQALFCEESFAIPPEQYLSSLDTFLRAQNVAPGDITSVFVVNGPGSFTASRVSVVLANTVAFVQNCPVRTIANPDRMPLSELVLSFLNLPDQVFAVPSYDRPPNIT